MKSVNVAFIVFVLLVSTANTVFANKLANGTSLRSKHYATCAMGATPRESFYVRGHYVISTSKVRYIGSCSPNKQKYHSYRLSAYNYQNYMN